MSDDKHEAIKVYGVWRSDDGKRKLCGEFDCPIAADMAAANAARFMPGYGGYACCATQPFQYEVAPFWRSSQFGPASNKCSAI